MFLEIKKLEDEKRISFAGHGAPNELACAFGLKW